MESKTRKDTNFECSIWYNNGVMHSIAACESICREMGWNGELRFFSQSILDHYYFYYGVTRPATEGWVKAKNKLIIRVVHTEPKNYLGQCTVSPTTGSSNSIRDNVQNECIYVPALWLICSSKAETAALLCPINAKMVDRTLKPFQDQSGWDTITVFIR